MCVRVRVCVCVCAVLCSFRSVARATVSWRTELWRNTAKTCITELGVVRMM